MSDKVSVGGGVFTDLSLYDPATAVRRGSIDYSYAFGTGTLGNLELSPITGGARTALRFDPVTAHEFVFHVGSTLSR